MKKATILSYLILLCPCAILVQNTPLANSSSSIAEPEAIDLGLSVKWASFNLGASSPQEYGSYFAWGEIQTKQKYDWDNYKFGSNAAELTKYVTEQQYGKDGNVDNKTILEYEDDAASTLLGKSWRMPTNSEMNELIKNCTWIWTSENGVNGYRIKGQNNKTIFLPASGMYLNADNNTLSRGGRYWTSEVFTQNDMANTLYFDSSHISWDAKGRPDGLTIRPVLSTSSDESDGIAGLSKHKILMTTNEGVVTISGLEEGEKVSFYSIDGRSIAAYATKNGEVSKSFNSNTLLIISIKGITYKILVK